MSCDKIAQIFSLAGSSCSRLSVLIASLNEDNPSSTTSSWDEHDLKKLKDALNEFGNKLDDLCDNIKNKKNK